MAQYRCRVIRETVAHPSMRPRRAEEGDFVVLPDQLAQSWDGSAVEIVKEETGGVETATDERQAVETTSNTPRDVSQYHTGGGWYELPNGERVRGKDDAQQVLNELEE